MVGVSLKSNRQSSEDKLSARAARFASAPPAGRTELSQQEPELTPEVPKGSDTPNTDRHVHAKNGSKQIQLRSRSRSRLRARIEKAKQEKQQRAPPPPPTIPPAAPPPPQTEATLESSSVAASSSTYKPRRAVLREAPRGESVHNPIAIDEPVGVASDVKTSNDTPPTIAKKSEEPMIDRPPGNFEEPPGTFDEHKVCRTQQAPVLQQLPMQTAPPQMPYGQASHYQPQHAYSVPHIAFSSFEHPTAYLPPPVDMLRGDTGYGPLADAGGGQGKRRRSRTSASMSQSPRRKKKRKVRMRVNRLKPKPTPEPESTLEAQPLYMSGVLGPLFQHQSFTGWECALVDTYRRSFVSHRRNAFRASTLHEWYDKLKQNIQWKKPIVRLAVDDGVEARLPRHACWLTGQGCCCEYEYGGILWPPMQMPPWFMEITEKVSRACGLEHYPNSCNANYYESGTQSVGWHADDEPLFDAKNSDTIIISLSLGQSRTFELHPMDDPTKVTKLVLQNGDLCTMEGLLQKHYRHRVTREPDVHAPRINLTWRWVRKHQTVCPMLHR